MDSLLPENDEKHTDKYTAEAAKIQFAAGQTAIFSKARKKKPKPFSMGITGFGLTEAGLREPGRNHST